MPKIRIFIQAAALSLIAVINAQAAGGRMVIFDDIATEVTAPPASVSAGGAGATVGDLWVTLADLTRATKFVLKPQGVCRDELCFPIPKARRQAFLARQGTETWFNLSEFARLLHQPVAVDAPQSAWYFGTRPEAQNSWLTSLSAPDFTLPEMNGKAHSLRDYRGKKVLLLTWASW